MSELVEIAAVAAAVVATAAVGAVGVAVSSMFSSVSICYQIALMNTCTCSSSTAATCSRPYKTSAGVWAAVQAAPAEEPGEQSSTASGGAPLAPVASGKKRKVS